METPNPGTWSELPSELLVSIFDRCRFADFHRAKTVCRSWNISSKLAVSRQSGSPWLVLFPHGGSCVLYNPDEDRIYPMKRDLAEYQFLANSGNWFLVLDPKCNLHIIDLFNESMMIHLPPLESINQSRKHTIERIDDQTFITSSTSIYLYEDMIRGLLWVDEKTGEYIVVWFSNYFPFVSFCKKGDDHYTYIPISLRNPRVSPMVYDVVLRGYHLYIWRSGDYIRFLDLSGPQVVQGVTLSTPFADYYSQVLECSIAVRTSGEVLLVERILSRMESSKSYRGFVLWKKDGKLVEVDSDSLGDEALILDSGITVPANHTLGIKPNSIYFTSHYEYDYSFGHGNLVLKRDICVFNVATKTFKRFPRLSKMKIKDGQWFLPYTCGP